MNTFASSESGVKEHTAMFPGGHRDIVTQVLTVVSSRSGATEKRSDRTSIRRGCH